MDIALNTIMGLVDLGALIQLDDNEQDKAYKALRALGHYDVASALFGYMRGCPYDYYGAIEEYTPEVEPEDHYDFMALGGASEDYPDGGFVPRRKAVLTEFGGDLYGLYDSDKWEHGGSKLSWRPVRTWKKHRKTQYKR